MQFHSAPRLEHLRTLVTFGFHFFFALSTPPHGLTADLFIFPNFCFLPLIQAGEQEVSLGANIVKETVNSSHWAKRELLCLALAKCANLFQVQTQVRCQVFHLLKHELVVKGGLAGGDEGQEDGKVGREGGQEDCHWPLSSATPLTEQVSEDGGMEDEEGGGGKQVLPIGGDQHHVLLLLLCLPVPHHLLNYPGQLESWHAQPGSCHLLKGSEPTHDDYRGPSGFYKVIIQQPLNIS